MFPPTSREAGATEPEVRAEALTDRPARTRKQRAEALPAQPAPTTHTKRPATPGASARPSRTRHPLRQVPRHTPPHPIQPAPLLPPPTQPDRGACRGTDRSTRAHATTPCRGTAGAAGTHHPHGRPAHAGCLGTPFSHAIRNPTSASAHTPVTSPGRLTPRPRRLPRSPNRGACRGTDRPTETHATTACRGTAGAAGTHHPHKPTGSRRVPRHAVLTHHPQSHECLGTHPGHLTRPAHPAPEAPAPLTQPGRVPRH